MARGTASAICIVVLATIVACSATQPAVVEKLDELTAVTITYGRTPLIMSPDTSFSKANERDFVQMGAIEVNRMGARQHYVWLGISEVEQMASADRHPAGYDSIVLIAGDRDIRLDVLGWSPQAIDASEPVYAKLFANSADAYYRITLDQIRLLSDTDKLKLRTTGSSAKEFVPWYEQAGFREDLGAFLGIVMR